MKIYVLIMVSMMIMTQVYADLALSVIPYEGGTDLRFERVESGLIDNKEVKLRITSTDSTQYQVFQRMIEPLTNERGVRLPEYAFEAYSVFGSNASGTLYQEDPLALGYADQLLYTSSAAGNSDTMSMIYRIRGDQLNASGNFFGKIIYTLQSIGGSNQATYIFNVYVSSSGEFKAELISSTGSDLLNLNSQTQADNQVFATISFDSNFSQDIRIYQEIISFPVNSEGKELSEDAVRFFVAPNAAGNVYHNTPTYLSRKQQLIYSSGQNNDSFNIYFNLDREILVNQSSGTYKSRIEYSIESQDAYKKLFLDLEVDVEPIFELEVKFPPEGVSFSGIKPNDQPQTKEVIVKVRTNLFRPYIVSQTVDHLLVDSKGEKLDPELFTVKTELIGAEIGEAGFNEFTTVSLGDSVLFFSDNKGVPTEFKVTYKMESNFGVVPGDYSTALSYSLGER